MVTYSVLPALAVLAPALGALLVACTGGRRVNLREGWSFAAGVVMTVLIALMIPEVRAGRFPGCTLFELLPGVELGRINSGPLDALWRDAPALARLRERRQIPLASFEFCDGCGYVPYCTGNCPGLASSLTGEIDHPSPDACLRRYLGDDDASFAMGEVEGI